MRTSDPMPPRDRPAPGEELHAGPPSVPRQAATIILLRGGSREIELLMVKRTPRARFMGGVWVFPGGAVEAWEGHGDRGLRAAAIRELAEEAGVHLTDTAALVKFSRWITPAEVEIRYDTHFFLAELRADGVPEIDGSEIVDYRWLSPLGALEAHRRGEILLVLPTIEHLEQLSGFRTAAELLDYARGREVVPVRPGLLGSGEHARLVLPGEPGYER